MKITRRQALSALASGAIAGFAPRWGLPRAWAQTPHNLPTLQYDIASGPFQPTWESLEKTYHLPDWYRDAKFGIWMHWGPQCQPGDGDWYAKYMYDQGRPQYNFHLQKYGHPSKFGFKDVINEWKAEKWDPAALHEALQRRRREVPGLNGESPRQLRQLQFQISDVELGESRPQEGHRRHLGEARSPKQHAFRRQRPRSARMELV